MPYVLAGTAVAGTTTGAYITAAASGFASGGIAGGNLNSALTGAFTAIAFMGAGDLVNTHGLTGGDFGSARHLQGVLAHAVVGCASGAAAGGSCRAGAIGAGFSMLATPGIASLSGNDVVGTVAAALVGGVGSHLSGGSF